MGINRQIRSSKQQRKQLLKDNSVYTWISASSPYADCFITDNPRMHGGKIELTGTDLDFLG